MPYYRIKKAKYKTKDKTSSDDSGYDSGYESDEGTEYSPVKTIGKGSYAEARLFQSKNKQKSVVVLNPVELPGDIGEARIKQRFFQTVYPEKRSPLFPLRNKDYRLIIPYISYVPYEKLNVDTEEFQRTLFRSAIQTLKDCHDKGMVMIDLKSDNIYYDSGTQKSYLIDGGTSARIGSPLDPLAFHQSSQKEVEECRKEYSHIAPECWSITPTNVVATPAMDVYSLGILMQDMMAPNSDVQTLIDSCLAKDPNDRPTLKNLIHSLDSLDSLDSIPESDMELRARIL